MEVLRVTEVSFDGQNVESKSRGRFLMQGLHNLEDALGGTGRIFEHLSVLVELEELRFTAGDVDHDRVVLESFTH